MTPQPFNGKKDIVTIGLKAPKELDDILTKAVELGFYESKSAFLREAINKELLELLLVLDAYQKAQEEVKNIPQDTALPPELVEMQIALKIIVDTPETSGLYAKFGEMISKAALVFKTKREEVMTFITTLREALKK